MRDEHDQVGRTAVAGRVGAVIVAAGSSTRMGFDKMWADLGQQPLVAWSLHAAGNSGVVDALALVAAEDHLDYARALIASLAVPLRVGAGGTRRRDSVRAGLALLGDVDWVIIHDGARPLVPPRLFADGLVAASPTGAAVAGLPSRDTIKRVRHDSVVETIPREELWLIQTPQVYRRDLLLRALDSSDDDVTDEAALLERMGVAVRVFLGDTANVKVTTPEDWRLVRALLTVREETRS